MKTTKEQREAWRSLEPFSLEMRSNGLVCRPPCHNGGDVVMFDPVVIKWLCADADECDQLRAGLEQLITEHVSLPWEDVVFAIQALL